MNIPAVCPAVLCMSEVRVFDKPVPYRIWGAEEMDSATLEQMDNACRLPIAVAGAQMPDGHVGYGLPIGGVLATRNAVIPYGVGVDIACRMKLSITDQPASRIDGWRDLLRKALMKETVFGVGGEFPRGSHREHDVMDDLAWQLLPPQLRKLHDKAWGQLGTSGSGNHFVEFGELVLEKPELNLEPGHYLALLSHSGSRGFGSSVARHYTDIAISKTRLPKHMKQLAWLDMSSEAGREYWDAMELAGRYAAANHDLIHRFVLRAAGLKPIVQIENHHNFAWRERLGGEDVIVHRKGATPAGFNVLGVIPGTMGDAGFVVRGKGDPASINSAAHGAGRRLSRNAARQTLTASAMRKYLEGRGVELISAGVDEAPMAYKDIDRVMQAQSGLVEAIARFQPRIVLMSHEARSED